MRILFCNIAWMKYYKGHIDGKDVPQAGGSYVTVNKDAHEKFNFQSEWLVDSKGCEAEYCIGFVETKSKSSDKANQLHIEKIDGCELLNNEEEVDDVLVVYCAKHPAHNFTTIVGWYKHATVFRNYQCIEFNEEGQESYFQYYNAIAKKEDCVLLPTSARSRKVIWSVPRKMNGASYGFGRSNVWFASGAYENEYLREFLHRIEKQIEEYDGENWLDKFED